MTHKSSTAGLDVTAEHFQIDLQKALVDWRAYVAWQPWNSLSGCWQGIEQHI